MDIKFLRVALGFCFFLWGANAIAQATYTVSGNVTGIDAIAISGVQLRLSTSATPSEDITVSGDGVFNFSTLVPDGSSYTVNFLPLEGVTCPITNASGTIAGENVTDVLVSCIAVPGSGTTAVPVMPLWLLGLMAAAIAGIASMRIKKKC